MTDSLQIRRITARTRLDALSGRAGFAIAWERLWPAFAGVLVVIAIFLAVSFVGVWLEVPRWARIGGTAVFGLAIAGVLGSLVSFRRPTRGERLARVDRDSNLPHRPATTIEDRLANGNDDPTTRAIWELHRKRAEEAATKLKVRLPSPRLMDRDRYALRGAAALAVVATAFIAGPEKYARVLAAFDWRTPGALSQSYRLDAWIDPPAYTGKPPIILSLRDEAGAQKSNAARKVSAPVGSTIIVRSSENANVTIETEGALHAPKAEEKPAGGDVRTSAAPPRQAAISDTESRWTLRGDARLVLKRFGAVVAVFDINSIPDRAPKITLKETVRPNARGSLTIGYKIEDDYGVIGAEATFTKPVIGGRPVSGRSLVEPPKMALALPAGPGGLGETETTADLSDHAWAGARVSMTLTARDEAGNEGHSETVEVTLPQRTFVKPLAKALVEQRRNLILAPDDRKRVELALEALLLAPDRFSMDSSHYLGLTSIQLRLLRARTDPALVDVADLLWEMALRVEDGGLSDAERDLRAAQEALRDAMNRGASEEELRKLMENLRAALDKFLNELAQQAQRDRRDGDRNQERNAQNQRTITSQDLQNMLDRMQEMMRNGQMADAQRMLDQLQRMMENLQSARRQNQRGNEQAREMNRALDELDQLTREEQQLRDDKIGRAHV